jgi:hypothetical protein
MNEVRLSFLIDHASPSQCAGCLAHLKDVWRPEILSHMCASMGHPTPSLGTTAVWALGCSAILTHLPDSCASHKPLLTTSLPNPNMAVPDTHLPIAVSLVSRLSASISSAAISDATHVCVKIDEEGQKHRDQVLLSDILSELGQSKSPINTTYLVDSKQKIPGRPIRPLRSPHELGRESNGNIEGVFPRNRRTYNAIVHPITTVVQRSLQRSG